MEQLKFYYLQRTDSGGESEIKLGSIAFNYPLNISGKSGNLLWLFHWLRSLATAKR